ncbi:c-type cytochrome [Spirosoma luteum]|uniref:c-type cytochrome n=1 Tax=Spirosoma luteum TaxID=431553 RepID=UPI00035F68E7|nr:c-type cytochrome [Spirosoma luteum]
METQPDLPAPRQTDSSADAPVWQLITWLNALIGLIAVAIVGLLIVVVMVGLGDTTAPAQSVAWTTGPAVQTASVTPVVSSQPDGQPKPNYWHPPGDAQLPAGAAGKEIRYGRELVAHTAKYLGPNGSVLHLSNGMNCQNCHLDAGTKIMGNNYAAVFSTYPKFRERSGGIETVVKRITDCFERSLSGKGPDSSSREMKAMVAYMKWIGTGVPKGDKPKGAGLAKLDFLDRAADPTKGKLLYAAKCQSCHGAKGEGIKVAGDAQYTYPPLWGPHSYNDGAGLFRLSSFAGYVKNNMPFGASYESPMLTDAEAWDLAAFVNSMPRPHKDQHRDWPKIEAKPVDFPFAPYADAFSEKQHKFGPYQPIADAKKAADPQAK